MRIIVPMLAALALAGCGGGSEGNLTANDAVTAQPLNGEDAVNAADTINYSAEVLKQNDAQRGATFIRALKDASLECEHVDSATRIADQDKVPTWRVTCQGGINYMVSIPPNGIAKIISRTDR
ncbi:MULTISPECIES: hypothetical protein [unclassified Sphingomonas]|jgi:hypothetical protein|uniref:hypothetical protein n=1 Tax=unclassified Sphingomonas TaxID=196159 RepID=UPI0022B599AC|nr:hypothetical protein [Sphingomonas sp. NIBR02145]WHU04724.1 hypothetical protein O3305_09085 [Sphingomonas sp. NIBR02145]